MILISHTQKYRLPRYFYQNWLKIAKNEWKWLKLNDIESKLAYFEYILSYFSIISLFWLFSSRDDFGPPETVFGFFTSLYTYDI